MNVWWGTEKGAKTTLPAAWRKLCSLCSQERLENSRTGKSMISFGIAVIVGSWLIIGMPASHIKAHLVKPAGRFIGTVGLDQGWGVFAPVPQNGSLLFEGRIEYADGTSSVWTAPNRLGPLVEDIDYHWPRLVSVLRAPQYAKFNEPLVRYIVSQARAEGKSPVKVSLVFRTSNSNPPGRGPARGPWIDSILYTHQVEGEK